MSRIGKKLIVIPAGTDVKYSDGTLTVKGKEGSVSRAFKSVVLFEVVDGTLKTIPQKNDKASKALWGTYTAHAANMIAGVNKPFQKKLVIEGVGFKAEVKGTELVLNLGFSHQVKVLIPKDLKVLSEKGVITISGVDAEQVGQFSAKIRDLKRPEPYKGKGIHYSDEVVRRKQGKKTA